MITRSACPKTGMVALLVTMAVGLVIINGCGSTKLINVWRDPSYTAAPLHKVMVVAMRKDQIRRRMWEDEFVAALNKRQSGTVATPSYQLFPNEVPDTLALEENTGEHGFDGVLVVARVERGTLTTDVSGYTTNEPVTEYKHKWKTYVTHYESVFHPGYTDTSTVVSVRTDLLLAREDGRLVWSGTSKAVDPASAEQFRKAVANNVVAKLSIARLVP